MSAPAALDDAPRRAGALAAATLAVTACLVGALALLDGRAGGVGGRLPWYLVVGAVGFVGAVLALEGRPVPPRAVLGGAAGSAVGVGLGVGLGVEGLLYAARAPGRVFGSGTVLYLLAAALVAVGVCYWTVRHWRGVLARRRSRRRSHSASPPGGEEL